MHYSYRLKFFVVRDHAAVGWQLSSTNSLRGLFPLEALEGLSTQRVWHSASQCANRQIRLLSCMTCSLVPMQSSTYAAIVTCNYSTNNAPHRYSYCKRRQLRWQHFCIPACGFLGISPLKKEPPARLKSRKSFA